MSSWKWKLLLPPAHVVRREGNVLARVCPSISLSTGGGVTQLTQPGGGQSAYSAVGWGSGSVHRRGQSAGGVSLPGGSAGGARGGKQGVVSQGGQLGGGSAKVGQQNEYSLHSGRYASCVHAGGLSCFTLLSEILSNRSESGGDSVDLGVHVQFYFYCFCKHPC